MTEPKPPVVGLNAREHGRLPDGTPFFAPLGEIPYDVDEDKVQCHLCDDWFRLIGASHVRWHGWKLEDYREAFHLLNRTSTASSGVSSRLRRNAMAPKATSERWADPPPARTPRLIGRGVPRWRSLAERRPDLAVELHPTRNGDLDPYQLGLGSSRRVWWRCGRCPHEWQASISHRVSRGGTCRRCTNNSWHVPRERLLAVLCPELAGELHPTRNGELDPHQLGAGSKRRVWWRCGDCGHQWRALVRGRSKEGYGCPRCARKRQGAARRRVPRQRSLAALRPELAAELHPTRNGNLDASQLARWSVHPVWWQCATCQHEWAVTPQNRAGCPRCSKRQDGP